MFLIFLIPILVAAVLIGSWYAYRIAFYSPQEGRDDIPQTSGKQYDPYRPRMRQMYRNLADRPCEFVSITSHDGLTLSGRYYHLSDNAPLALCFHGYKSHALTDFSGGCELSFELGHNVLLVDQRSHGKSDGKAITYGILERRDLLRWVDYAVSRFGSDTRILLYGISMGGATVLMASELPLPKNVKAIVADCPYAVPEDIILHIGAKLHYPPRLVRPFLHMGAYLYGKFHLKETDAAKAVRNANIPILIIHGESDNFVPVEMSEAVSLANPELVTRVTIPGADHGISYLVDTPRYKETVVAFLNQVLS